MVTGCWSSGRRKKYPYYLVHKQNINVRKEVFENAFKNWLNQFKMDITHFEKLQALVKGHLEKGINDKKLEAEKLQKRATELKAKQHVLIEKNIEGIISNDLCKEKIAAIDTELYQINRLVSNLPQATINYDRLLAIIRNILKNPGEVWEKADFTQKIKLQWFYFPHGIEFDGIQSRTTKICRLFNLKEYISSTQSYGAPHRNSKSNTINQQISLPSENNIDIQSTEFWQEVWEEIKFLSSLK
jgi:site-specific DNA recombinase